MYIIDVAMGGIGINVFTKEGFSNISFSNYLVPRRDKAQQKILDGERHAFIFFVCEMEEG